MTDLTPTPNAAPAGIQTLSMEQIIALERRIRENKAAQLRGEPLPHDVKPEEIKAAIQSVRASRGTLNFAEGKSSGKKKGSGGKAQIEIIDGDEL